LPQYQENRTHKYETWLPEKPKKTTKLLKDENNENDEAKIQKQRNENFDF